MDWMVGRESNAMLSPSLARHKHCHQDQRLDHSVYPPPTLEDITIILIGTPVHIDFIRFHVGVYQIKGIRLRRQDNLKTTAKICMIPRTVMIFVRYLSEIRYFESRKPIIATGFRYCVKLHFRHFRFRFLFPFFVRLKLFLRFSP